MRPGWFLLAALGFAEDVASFTRVRNAITLRVGENRTEVEWITPATVRVRRDMSRLPGPMATKQREAVEVGVADSEEVLFARSKELAVEIRKRPFRIAWRVSDEPPLLSWDGAQFQFSPGVGERFFGLGIRPDPQLTLPREIIPTDNPFLLSSRFYGLHFPRYGEYRFDFRVADRLALIAPEKDRDDFYFYSGGGLKEVLEQHHRAQPDDFSATESEIGDPVASKPDYAFALPEQGALAALLQGAMSAMPVPTLSTAHTKAEIFAPFISVMVEDARRRLSHLATAQRRSFLTHRLTYLLEARDRGLPVIHPLPLQFPRDASVTGIADEFMFGDEVIVAMGRTAYLPQGIWTDLETGLMYRGRQRIRLGNAPRMLARNGTIVPRDRDFGLELHYYPRLGAEYFIPEGVDGIITQVHAGPSADVLRLEIEARGDRTVEWVVHNVIRPSQVERNGERLAPSTWVYDEESKLLRLRARVAFGEDIIWNVSFSREEWYIHP